MKHFTRPQHTCDFLSTLVLFFGLLFLSNAANSQVVIRMDTVTAHQGDSITIPVFAQQLNNTGSFTFFIGYSTSVLHFGRSLNLHPSLSQGIFLSNASGGQVGIVWADQAGASLPEGKLFDLKFKYISGSTYLNFTSQCEITDVSGNPFSGTIQYVDGYATRKLAATITANPPVLCMGDTTFLSFTTVGGLGEVSWNWFSDPAGFASTQANPWDVPSNSLYYNIMTTDGNDTAYDSFLVTVYFFQTPTAVENMLPANGTQNLNLPLLLSWNPAMAASQYDVYVWEESQTEPSSPMVSNTTQISYLLSGFLEYGKNYHWRVVSKNPCIQTPGPVQSFGIRHLPDLVVWQVNAPSQAFSGQNIPVTFQVKNGGQGSTQTTQWNDVVYLSTDTTIDPAVDYYIGAYPNLSYLDPGETYTQQVFFTIPQGISGNYYVLVMADRNQQLIESQEENNTAFNQDTLYVFLSPVPDLRVAKIVVQTSAFSGQAVSITWNVKNYGLASTGNLSWSDRVYFSNQEELGSGAVNLGTFQRSGDLAPDSLYQLTKTVHVPNYIYGRYYFIVTTDVYNQVYEHALENNNNLASDSVTVFLTPPPDLAVTSVIAPGTASVKQPVNIQYTVQNQGANPAGGKWHDRIYISNSLVLNTNTAFQLKDIYQNRVVLPDSSYTLQTLVTVPDNILGPYYFFVFTDAKQEVFEHLEEENNIARSPQPTAILAPDLVPDSLQAFDTLGSGEKVLFQYFSRNQGPGMLSGSWTDKVFLSRLAVFQLDSCWLIGNAIFSNTYIAAGDSLMVELLVTMPNGISGDFYLYVQGDYHNTLFEGSNENNNITRGNNSLHVTLTPWPDLLGESLLLPDTITAGLPFPWQYATRNTGPGPLLYQGWKDKFIFSTNPNAPTNNFYTFFINDTASLEPDSVLFRETSMALPSSFSPGNYYLWRNIDDGNVVYEHGEEDNNLSRSQLLHVLPYPPVDLVALSLTAPDSCFSGQAIQVSWTGQNQGTVLTKSVYWQDRLYLSNDTVYSADDIYLEQVGHTGHLPPLGTYTASGQMVIPNGISGDYYVFVNIDRSNNNFDPVLSNNRCLPRYPGGLPKPLHVTFTPPPDLVVTTFQCPATGVTGQPLTIPYTVANQGIGTTPGALWYDRFYLSTDFAISLNDHDLGYRTRLGSLEPGAFYHDTITFIVPSWATGNKIILMKTDASDLIYEHTNEDNNLAAQAVSLQLPPPSDLIISQIIPPTEALLGDEIHIEYTLHNSGDNPATGLMRDLVYLSADTVWDMNDVLFGSVEGYVSIGPGASFNRGVNGITGGVVPGDWFVIVRADVLNNIIESNDLNNQAYSVQTIAVTVPLLPMDTWVMRSMPHYSMVYYRIEVPDSLLGETLFTRLLGDSVYGNNELYISYESLPTRTTYDWAYGTPNAGNQEILIPSLQPGVYYLLVYGRAGQQPVQQIQLHAMILPFQIISVDASKGGNTGEVTLRLNGSKFTPNMAVFLEKDGVVIEGYDLVFVDLTRVFVSFGLNGADTGTYTLVANKFCDGMALLEDAFTIAAGTSPDLQVNLYYPSGARPMGIVSVIIEYANAGNIDLIAPEVEFLSLDEAPVSLTVSGLQSGQTSLLLPLQELNGPPGVLRPGTGGTITVYARASKALAFTLRLPNY